MWNDPLVTPMPKTRPPASKAPPKKPAKKKPKPKPRAKSTNKLEKDVAALKELTKAQAVTIARLSEIVSTMQLGDANRFAGDT